MGDWGVAPWDNDYAADWYHHLFKQTKLAEYIGETLQLNVEEHADTIRAAAHILGCLGRVYILPGERLSSDLSLAVIKLKEIKNQFQEDGYSDDLIAELDKEIAALEQRNRY